MCKFYEYSVDLNVLQYSVPEVEFLHLLHRVTAIHRYEFGFHSPFAYSNVDCDLS